MQAKIKHPKKDQKDFEQEITLNGVTASYSDGVLTVKGDKGEVSRQLKFPRVYLNIEGSTIKIGTNSLTKREKKIINTYRAHVENMIRGVTSGFEYKLRVVYAKFPITIEFKDNMFTLKNLLGEKVPRTVKVPQDVSLKIEGGKEVVINGIDIEKCGQVAASIEQMTRINHLDRRVIQDGIYIVEKPKKELRS